MKNLSVAELATITAGELIGGNATASVGPDVVIDTRKATPGCLFVALPGERVDGHDFTLAAAEAGAAAVLVTRPTETTAAQVLVGDGVDALSSLARHVVAGARERGVQVLALTGSSGKTSTKDVLTQLLETHAPTVSPVGSFNNEIGVPLTACELDDQSRFLVSEMGARGAGHIAWLCSIVPPDISIVLNVGTAHLGEFGSVDAIAQAKGELVEALPEGGWAVLNHDDARVAAMAQRVPSGAQVAWFSLDEAAQPPAGGLLVQALDASADDLQRHSFTLRAQGTHSGQARVSLPLMGRHHVANAAAAVAAALIVGVDFDDICQTLSALQHRSAWRMELSIAPDGLAVINDAYNANPDSMAGALRTLAEVARSRKDSLPGARSVAILGDMLELGERSDQLHARMGELAATLGIDRVIAVGDQAEHIANGVRQAADESTEVEALSIASASSLDLAPDDVVLVKASRGLALERVAAALLAAHSPVAPAGTDDPQVEDGNVSAGPQGGDPA